MDRFWGQGQKLTQKAMFFIAMHLEEAADGSKVNACENVWG